MIDFTLEQLDAYEERVRYYETREHVPVMAQSLLRLCRMARRAREAETLKVERDAARAAMEGLRPIAEAMRGQDNRATSHPVYVVETKTGRMGGYEFVTAFFSESAADAYVASNAHNLKKPRVFVYSAYRNREWQAVRACLLALVAEHGATSTNEVETC